MIRAYILIQTVNGIRFKYVRDITEGDTVGDTGSIQYASYYTYGDTAGDTFGAQGDSSQIQHNFNTLLTNIASGDSYVLFPESAGDTYTLLRPNQDQLVDYGGDSTWVDITPNIRTVLRTAWVQGIQVIEERIPRDQSSEKNVYIP